MRRKPLSGALLGILIGLAVAVILARTGVWPADQLTVFLIPSLIGLGGLLLLSIGKENSTFTMVIALLLLVPMLVWGALGLGSINQTGELNGGCTVEATSDVDTTTVTDTSRSDPFEIDPAGGLTWMATSPEVFSDYEWRIAVLIGGIPIPIDSDTEANDAGDVANDGAVPDVGAYAAERGIDVDLYRGVYQVGGSAATCDGFGFVRILGDDSTDLITIIAGIAAITFLVILIVLAYLSRKPAGETTDEPTDAAADDPTEEPGPAADAVGSAGAQEVSGTTSVEEKEESLPTTDEITEETPNEDHEKRPGIDGST